MNALSAVTVLVTVAIVALFVWAAVRSLQRNAPRSQDGPPPSS